MRKYEVPLCFFLFLYSYDMVAQQPVDSIDQIQEDSTTTVLRRVDDCRLMWWRYNAGDSYDTESALKLMDMLEDWTVSLIIHAPSHAVDTVVTNGMTQIRMVMLWRSDVLQNAILKHGNQKQIVQVLTMAQHVLHTFPWELPTTRCDYVGTAVALSNALYVDNHSIAASLSDRINEDGLDHIAVSALLGMLNALGSSVTYDVSELEMDEQAYETCKTIFERAIQKNENSDRSDIDESFQGLEGVGHANDK